MRPAESPLKLVPSIPWRHTVQEVAQALAATAIARDERGGTAKAERDLIRQSGLLTLSIPTEFGGLGASWQDTMGVVREFARVDSSVAHLFAFHHLLLATTRLFGQPAQWRAWHEQTVAQRWFWGNALNPLDKATVALPSRDDTQGVVFRGTKSFCSGASDSDMLLASALNSEGRLLIGVVPTARRGIHVRQDWHNMGQRQTDSGSVHFDDVPVAAQELLTEPGPLSSPYACLRPLLAQLILANVYLGLGEGALQEARAFTLGQGRPWITSTAPSAQEDPYVLGHYGDFWLALQGARALTDQAATAFDRAWQRGLELSVHEQIGRAHV